MYCGGSDCGLLFDGDDIRVTVADGGVWWGGVYVVVVRRTCDGAEWRGACFGAAICNGDWVGGVFERLVGRICGTVGLCELLWVLSAEVRELFEGVERDGPGGGEDVLGERELVLV